MEKQKVIEKATKCLDAMKRGRGNYRPLGYVEFADKIYEEWEDFYATVVIMAKEPERKKGRWIRPTRPNTYERFCSECQEKAWFCGKGDYDFCPNCGADMRGGKDATD